jgi:serine/threonine protein phosphatase PrpC
MGSLCNKKKIKNKKLVKKEEEKEEIKDEKANTDSAHDLIFAHCLNGRKKKEGSSGQDSHDIITYELGENIKYFAVYDGHGEYGQKASQFLRNEIRKSLIKDRSKIPKFVRREQVEKYFKDLFRSIQKKTEKNEKEYLLSGSCAICVLRIEDKLYTINLGDSRAVLGRMKLGKREAVEMSIDHKPHRDDEMKRILEKGGEVLEKGSTYRIYKKNDEQPGLAVARSIGDLMGHECGVSSEPEVIEKEIDGDDIFIVIGSDGIWDALSSIETIGFLLKKMEGKKNFVAKMLVEEARNRWELISMFRQKTWNEFIQSMKDKNSKNNNELFGLGDIDDITSIVHFIND